MRLVLGTTNQGKIKEYTWIFGGYNSFELVKPEELGIDEKPKEIGNTFEENALIKAQFYCKKSRLPSLSDDGGIEIDALGGGPGVKSRRWLGRECSDEELINHCLAQMKDVPHGKRGAQFRDVAILAFPDGRIFKGEGMQQGYIATKVIKEFIPGFPFRSLFFRDNSREPPDYLWEGHYSHRKDAINEIMAQLNDRI